MRSVMVVGLVAIATACAVPARRTVVTRTAVWRAVAAPAGAAVGSVTLAPRTLDRLDLVALSAHGRWEESVAYGRVWIPREALASGFVPYVSHGQWVATARGWGWQSTLPWGEIPFHFGRWVELEGVWAWVPGTAWAPAWVEWRGGGSWIGWAALPPLGAAFAAPFAYCNAATLAGGGLQARTVVGPAAVSLFALTAPLAAGPSLPGPRASVTSDPAPIAGSEAPSTIEAIPRALAAAAAGEASARSMAFESTAVIRGSERGATLHLAGGDRPTGGYSTVPAARVAVRAPLARPPVAADSAPSTPAWDRSVAAPPPAIDPPGGFVAPVAVAWGAPRSPRDGVVPLGLRHFPPAVGGVAPRALPESSAGPARPVSAAGIAPPVPTVNPPWPALTPPPTTRIDAPPSASAPPLTR